MSSNLIPQPSMLELNSQSIAHLCAARYGEANAGLGQVLEQMKSYIQASSSSPAAESPASKHGLTTGAADAATDDQEQDQGTGAAASSFILETVDVPVRRAAAGTAPSNPKDVVFCLYARAFSVPVLPLTKAGKAVALMAFVYNLAMTRHLEALNTQETVLSRELLEQAGKLYQSALRVASSHMEDEESFEGFQCLLLATANNYAHVYTEHVNVQEAGKGVSMMHSLLQEPSVLRNVPEADYSFFETNVVTFLESPLFSIAPAA